MLTCAVVYVTNTCGLLYSGSIRKVDLHKNTFCVNLRSIFQYNNNMRK